MALATRTTQIASTTLKFQATKPRANDIPPNINAVRGLACLLIVALHVVGDSASNGLRLPMTSDWHYAMASIEFLRLPIFTALSGYLYACHRVTKSEIRAFWVKKLRRLFVPLIFATVVVWLLRSHADEDQPSLLHVLLFEYGHLWYLQALLILFAGISIADAFFRPGPITFVLTGLTAIMIAQAGIPVTTFFGMAGAVYIVPYFLFGIVLRGQPEWLRDPHAGALSFGIIAVVLIGQQLGLLGITQQGEFLQLQAAIAGMAGVVLLLQRFPGNRLLARIGHYSYSIYLWHIVASAATRTLLIKAGVTAIPELFLGCLAAGLAAPIILFHIARHVPFLSVAVTGDHWIHRTKRASSVQLSKVVATL